MIVGQHKHSPEFWGVLTCRFYDCRSGNKFCRKVVVRHSYREGNQCADALANNGCTRVRSWLRIILCLSKCIEQHVVCSYVGNVFPRLISL
jgi:hypothetical protein